MFGGYDSIRRGTPDTIAKVGNIPIKVGEFQNEYNRQLQFYTQLFGGNLTSKQIESFKIKDNIIQSLVNQKLILSFAERLDLKPSRLEIKREIKGLPYFKTNDQFDLEKYKLILARNGHTPSDFEEIIASDLKMKKAQQILTSFPVSKTYQNEIAEFKKERLSGSAVVINKNELSPLIPVSADEIKKYLETPENKKKVEGIFTDRKESLSQKEEVKARHILLKTDEKNEKEIYKKITQLKGEATVENFAKLADKHTEDPSGKGKGGALDWFTKGVMAPEFEKMAFSQKIGSISAPVKSPFGYHIILVEGHKEAKEALLKDHEEKLAKELIQRSKPDELKKIEAKIMAEVKELLKSKNEKEINRKKDEYKLTYTPSLSINRIDGTKGSVTLSHDEITELFTKATDKKEFFEFNSVSTISILSLSKESANEKELAGQTLSQEFARKLNQDLVKELEKNTKVKVYNDVFNL